MSLPVINPVTSIPNWGISQPFDFALFATNTPTSWTITGLANGISYNSTTGLISGTPTKACHLDCTAKATNGTGDSAVMSFVIIVPEGSVLSAAAQLVNFDLESAAITTNQPAFSPKATGAPAPIMFGKTGSKLLLAVGFVRGGTLVPVNLAELNFALKEYEPESQLLLTSGDFRYLDTDNGPRYQILVDITASKIKNIASNYEDDADSYYDGRAQLTPSFLEVVATGEDPSVLARGSQTFGIRIARSLA
jgi:hypothetical protein